MEYDAIEKQWLLDPTECDAKGERLIALLEMNDVPSIDAGTVMVFQVDPFMEVLFQLLHPLSYKLRDVELIYYEPGSVVSPSRTPTILFRGCRLPTRKEFENYKRKVTV